MWGSPAFVAREIWLVWIVSWWAAALWSKRAVKRPAIRQEIVYRVLAIAGAIAMFGVRHLPAPWIAWRIQGAFAWALIAGLVAGMVFSWWARLHIGTLWSSSVTRKADHRIVDTGPYGIVRHPIYTGLDFSIIATAVLFGTVPALGGGALMILGFYVKARLEERFLRQELGPQAYDAYASRVPMLVPGAGGGRAAS